MRTVAVVLAGGSGRRFGGSMPKQLQLLAGRTLVEHCVAAFDEAPGIDEVLVVIGEEFVTETTDQLRPYRKLIGVVPGGTARSDSTRQAIAALLGRSPAARTAPGPARAAGAAGAKADAGADGGGEADRNVLFHDAARPLVDQRIIADCVAALGQWQAIGVVVPSTDTIVEVAGGVLGQVLPRESLARCQTPQGFRLSVIARAHELAAADPDFRSVTDDCGVVRRYLPQVPIGAVTGSERNIKVTYPGDLELAELFLRQAARHSS
jgi:2-C-methyl-D-erythritol 4-phosphate cytidylyltransferase